MFDLYEYLTEHLAGDDYVKAIYRCTGLYRMEELLSDIRSNEFPCVMVEIGSDGWIDMRDANNTSSIQTFYVLGDCRDHKIEEIKETLSQTMAKGRLILDQMIENSSQYGSPCFGIDFSKINFMKVGPLGIGSYGYGFTLNIVEQ